MRRNRQAALRRAVPVHLGMGLVLGTLLAMALLASDTRSIFAMIVNGAMPLLTMTVFVAVFAAVIGIGSVITGVIFTAVEND